VLGRFRAVRPDLEITGVDREDFSSGLPEGIEFRRVDAEREPLPFPDDYFDGVTLIHLVEHLEKPGELIREVFRVLKPGGAFYLETPDRKSLRFPSLSGWLPDLCAGPLNFYDDPTHLRIWLRQDLFELLRPEYPAELGFGLYRNRLYAALAPLLVPAGALLRRRRWVVVGSHNLFGWSLYCRGRKGPLTSSAVAHPGRRRLARLADRLLCFPVSLLRRRGGNFPAHPPASILVVRPDHLGDVLISTSVFRALKEKYPSARVTALVGPWSAELLRHNPFVDQVITLDCPWWSGKRGRGAGSLSFLSRYRRFLREARRERFQAGIDLRGDIRHILLFLFLPGIPQRVAYDRSGGAALLTTAVPAPGFFSLGESEKNRRLLAEGLGIKGEWTEPRVYWTDTDRSTAEELLRAAGIGPGETVIALSPSARSPLRTWPPERFAGLADRLAGEFSARIVLLGGPDASPLAGEIAGRSRTGPVNLAGKTTLLQAAALCSRSRLFVGVEGGLMHLAAAAGTPVVALYGPMRPELTRPRRDNFFPVYHPLPCSPCLQLECPYSASPRGRCMEKISLEDVLAAVRRALSGG